jgi:hypothetical protein
MFPTKMRKPSDDHCDGDDEYYVRARVAGGEVNTNIWWDDDGYSG